VNITYWIVVTILLVIALVIIIPPLLKRRDILDADSDQRNINIAQERAEDLKLQLAAGTLSQQQFDEQYGELELTLGDDLDIEQNNNNSSSHGSWVVYVILITVPLLSVLTYFSLGEPDALIKAEMKAPQRQQAGKKSQDMNLESMVQKLAERLKQNPDNVNDWVMLGRSYKFLKQYPMAIKAFEKAYALGSDEPAVMLHYADALVMADRGRFSAQANDLIFSALEKTPNDAMALWLAGTARAEQRNFSQALVHWHKLEKLLPPDSDSYKEVQKLIASVQGLTPGTNKPVEKVITQTKVETDAAVSIDVQVSLSADFKSRVSPDDTVFIYAKALTGPPMPLAIVRKKVADLPITATLNDAMAMMPTMKLSNFKAVKVMARISKSGTAMQQKGDLVGSLELSELTKNQAVLIVINEEM